MTAFFDTSALLKIYVDEPGSQVVRRLATSTPLAVSELAYVEARAAFARRRREQSSHGDQLDRAVQFFEGHWASLGVVRIRVEVVRTAAALCDAHPLRAGDALQLASALELHSLGVAVTFVGSDQRLLLAAAAEGLAVLDPEARTGTVG